MWTCVEFRTKKFKIEFDSICVLHVEWLHLKLSLGDSIESNDVIMPTKRKEKKQSKHTHIVLSIRTIISTFACPQTVSQYFKWSQKGKEEDCGHSCAFWSEIRKFHCDNSTLSIGSVDIHSAKIFNAIHFVVVVLFHSLR